MGGHSCGGFLQVDIIGKNIMIVNMKQGIPTSSGNYLMIEHYDDAPLKEVRADKCNSYDDRLFLVSVDLEDGDIISDNMWFSIDEVKNFYFCKIEIEIENGAPYEMSNL